MIEILELSAGNEMPVARRLAEAIARAWPDVATSLTDRVSIAVGARICRECDLLVALDLERPRALPPLLRRNGTMSPDAEIQAAMIVIEVKQLEASRFTLVGTQIFPDYHDGKKRSVDAQVADCCTALVRHRNGYGVERFFIHGVGWLTEVPEATLAPVNPWIVGAESDWSQILDAAAQQDRSLYGERTREYRAAIATIFETLTRKRAISPRDRTKADELCRDVLADEVIDDLAAQVGNKQVRLTGRGGSGKTTTLALLAKRLASIDQARVLVLTFHKTLRGDIAHLIDTLVDRPDERARIRVETAVSFFTSALRELGEPLPMIGNLIDFARLPSTLADVTAKIGRARGLGEDEAGGLEIAYLRESDPARFDYDYVFVDEAQDWLDPQRDFVRALYGPRNMVVADGLEQLVNRQTACDWTRGIPTGMRHHRHLGRSLRMTRNVACFANAFAREIGLVDWKIEPYEKLAGGRIVIALGEIVDTVALIGALESQLSGGNASPIDALLCVPPSDIDATGERRFSRRAAEIAATGRTTWDASQPHIRDGVPTDVATWRVVQYESCRGLEGWTTVAFGLDRFAENKRKHPNLAPGESDTPENVVNRWLMIALTRAVHTLVIAIDDPDAPIVAALRGASVRLPGGVVEWTTGAACASILRPPVLA